MELALAASAFHAIGRAEVFLAVLTAVLYPFVGVKQLAAVLEVDQGDVKTARMRLQHGIVDRQFEVRRGRAEGVVLLMRARLNPPLPLGTLTSLLSPPPTAQELDWATREVVTRHGDDQPRRKERAHYARAQIHLGPDGTAWCSRCCEFHQLDEFGKNKARASGRQDWCLRAVREYWRDRRASDRKRVVALR